MNRELPSALSCAKLSQWPEMVRIKSYHLLEAEIRNIVGTVIQTLIQDEGTPTNRPNTIPSKRALITSHPSLNL